MASRTFIFGASGSGTSTLGATLAERCGYPHLDTDNFYWESTNPPFQKSRERQQSQQLLADALDAHPRWVLSGCLAGWGDMFIPRFELVVFLSVPKDVRLERLRERERCRYGEEALAPGGFLHAAHIEFLNWAGAYDEGGENMRSRRRHEKWLAGLTCPVLRLEGARPVEQQLNDLKPYLTSV